MRVPEPALERALCLALGVDRENLTQSLVATQLRHLEANDKQIRNLTGLEAAQNLETLVLRDNLIENLLPISDLPNLKNLDLAGNKISSVADLVPLSRSNLLFRIAEIRDSLKDLSIRDELKSSMVLELAEILKKLKRGPWSLRSLNLSGNRLLGLTGVGVLRSLEQLNVSNNALIDLEGVGELKNLVTLYAQGNQLGRVEGFVDLNKDKQYSLGEPINDESGNGKRDVDPLVELRSLPRLLNLHLYENILKTVRSLSDLPSLRVLLLSGNQIQDLKTLQDFNSIKRLSLSDNKINDLSGIESLSNLEHLYLVENRICDLRPLAKLYNLRELYLQKNQFAEVSYLSRLNNLEILQLSNNLVHDPSPLNMMKSLTKLSLSGNSLNLEDEKIKLFFEIMSSRGTLVLKGDQRKRSYEAESLIASLIGHPRSNQILGDYLESNGYSRLIDFEEDSTISEDEKSLSYLTWESHLKNGKRLSDVPFPGD